MFCQSPQFVGNFTGLYKPQVWEHCSITWSGTKSPKSKAYESSLASPPSSSLCLRHIQTLSKPIQPPKYFWNLYSPLCPCCQFLRTGLLYFPAVSILTGLLATVSSLIHAHQNELFKNQKWIPIFHRIKVPYGLQGFSLVGLLAVSCSCFLLVLRALYLSLAWVTPDSLSQLDCHFLYKPFL